MDKTLITFGKPTYDLRSVSDDEFLRAIGWKSTAPSALQRAAIQGDLRRFCREWIALLQPRVKRCKVTSRRWHSLALWSIDAFEQNDCTDRLANFLICCEEVERSGSELASTKTKARRSIGSKTENEQRIRREPTGHSRQPQRLSSVVTDWLDSVDTQVSMIELLALFELLLHFSAKLTDDVLWNLWRTTLSAATEFSAQTNELDGSQVTEDQQLLILGELPWLCGLIFADITRSEGLRRNGQRFLCRKLAEKTDTDGTPDAKLIERLPLWLAPLVRAAQWTVWFELPLWNKESEERFKMLVTKVAPLCRPDGWLALSNGSSALMISLLQTASKLAGFQKNDQPRKYLQSLGNGKTKPRRKANRRMPVLSDSQLPVMQSDWAQFACLCDGWSVAANSIIVAHHREKPLIDLTAHGQTILSGVWDIDITIAGEPLGFDDDWECVCWQSDADCDYLELEATFSDGLTVNRQVLLSRTDDFVLLADAISGAGHQLIEYTSRLPVVAGLEATSSPKSRECMLKQRNLAVRAFPLALPQERVISTAGGFGPYGNNLVLKQVCSMDGLYAPLIIEWGTRGRRRAADWRTLTVTESQRVVNPGIAAGHRLRIGDFQLFIYRSLKRPTSSRAVLGLHTNNEAIVGELNGTGTVTPILLVE